MSKNLVNREDPYENRVDTAEGLALCNFAKTYLSNILTDGYTSLRAWYGAADHLRDLDTLNRRIECEGISFLVDLLPSLFDSFLLVLEGGVPVYTGFRSRNGVPVFLRRLFSLVQDSSVTSETQARAMEILYSICVAFKKLRGEPDRDSLQRNWEAFVDVEAEIGCINLDDDELQPILNNYQRACERYAGTLDYQSKAFVPRPGPGAVVGNIARSLRYSPHVMYTQLDEVFPYDEWFYSHPWDLVGESRNYKRLIEQKVSEPISQYLCVPKTFRKWRGICKEANETQFLQQAVRRLMMVSIRRYYYKNLPLEDQSVHAHYAKRASYNRKSATIDESEASDRILRRLVQRGFSQTEFWKYLDALSTRTIMRPKWAKGGKKFLRTHKFAPMGSAICFPVMSLIHLFLIQAIIEEHHKIDADGSYITYSTRRSLASQVSVYGDDIVLPSAVVPLIYYWLPKFGMKINQTKSFVHSHFRESCGCHAYKGVDITPVYLKYTPSQTTTDTMAPKALVSLLSNESLLHKKGFHRAARFLRTQLIAKCDFPLTYVPSGSRMVGFIRPSSEIHVPALKTFLSGSCRQKWDRLRQTYTYRVLTFQAQKEEGVIPTSHEALLRAYCIKPSNSVSFRVGSSGPVMLSGLDFVVDETQELSYKWVRVASSELMPVKAALAVH